MRTFVILLAAPLAISTTPPAALVSLPAYDEPARPWANVEDLRCRDRIEQVREAMGKPKLDRKPVSPDAPILHYAVDRRVDGCGVLVPVGDPESVIPPPQPGRPQLIPVMPPQGQAPKPRRL